MIFIKYKTQSNLIKTDKSNVLNKTNKIEIDQIFNSYNLIFISICLFIRKPGRASLQSSSQTNHNSNISLAACELLYNVGYRNLIWVQGDLETAKEEVNVFPM